MCYNYIYNIANEKILKKGQKLIRFYNNEKELFKNCTYLTEKFQQRMERQLCKVNLYNNFYCYYMGGIIALWFDSIKEHFKK